MGNADKLANPAGFLHFMQPMPLPMNGVTYVQGGSSHHS